MFKPFLRLVQFGGLAFVLGGCLFDGFGAGIPDVPSIKDDEPYVRALLDSNGMKDVPLYEILKAENFSEHLVTYYIALQKRGLTSFRFIESVKNIKTISTIRLDSNSITQVPPGILNKKWTGLLLNGNELCNLSQQDSANLEASGALWKNTQYCTNK